MWAAAGDFVEIRKFGVWNQEPSFYEYITMTQRSLADFLRQKYASSCKSFFHDGRIRRQRDCVALGRRCEVAGRSRSCCLASSCSRQSPLAGGDRPRLCSTLAGIFGSGISSLV